MTRVACYLNDSRVTPTHPGRGRVDLGAGPPGLWRSRRFPCSGNGHQPASRWWRGFCLLLWLQSHGRPVAACCWIRSARLGPCWRLQRTEAHLAADRQLCKGPVAAEARAHLPRQERRWGGLRIAAVRLSSTREVDRHRLRGCSCWKRDYRCF